MAADSSNKRALLRRGLWPGTLRLRSLGLRKRCTSTAGRGEGAGGCGSGGGGRCLSHLVQVVASTGASLWLINSHMMQPGRAVLPQAWGVLECVGV